MCADVLERDDCTEDVACMLHMEDVACMLHFIII